MSEFDELCKRLGVTTPERELVELNRRLELIELMLARLIEAIECRPSRQTSDVVAVVLTP